MSADEVATPLVLRSLARRIQAATIEASELEQEILGHIRALAPRLLDQPGVGPIVAAQLIVAWSHHGRLRSEARLRPPRRRRPDPRLQRPNDAVPAQPRRRPTTEPGLHTIVLHRRQHDPTTKHYIAQRIAEGKTKRDATRLLKRYLARHLYRLLQQEPLMA